MTRRGSKDRKKLTKRQDRKHRSFKLAIQTQSDDDDKVMSKPPLKFRTK